MKNYRVWEANRKVFLYPENWIEPELRDDKTPFFVNLESGLLQDEVNDSTVEREYLKYLQDSIAWPNWRSAAFTASGKSTATCCT